MRVVLVVLDELAYLSATLDEAKQQKEFTTLLRDLVARVRATRSGLCRPPRGKVALCGHGRHDHSGQVASTWHAPELWRRPTGSVPAVLRQGRRVPTPLRCALPLARPAGCTRRRLRRTRSFPSQAVISHHRAPNLLIATANE